MAAQRISRHLLVTKTSIERRWVLRWGYRKGGSYREHTGQGGPNGGIDRTQSRALDARLTADRQRGQGRPMSLTIGHAVVGRGITNLPVILALRMVWPRLPNDARPTHAPVSSLLAQGTVRTSVSDAPHGDTRRRPPVRRPRCLCRSTIAFYASLREAGSRGSGSCLGRTCQCGHIPRGATRSQGVPIEGPHTDARSPEGGGGGRSTTLGVSVAVIDRITYSKCPGSENGWTARSIDPARATRCLFQTCLSLPSLRRCQHAVRQLRSQCGVLASASPTYAIRKDTIRCSRH